MNVYVITGWDKYWFKSIQLISFYVIYLNYFT